MGKSSMKNTAKRQRQHMKHSSMHRKAGNAEYPHLDSRGVRSRVLPGVNMSELARVSGVSRSFLSLVVNGHSVAGLEVLKKLKAALGMESVEEVERWLQQVRVEGESKGKVEVSK